MTKNKQFHINNKTAQMIKISKDQLIQSIKHQSQKNIHFFIVDELPDISEAEIGIVYIIIDWIADNSIAYYHYYIIVNDIWVTVDENVDISKYCIKYNE